MANFTPSGIIKVGRVPFDNSYRHTMTFASREAQTTFFSSCCTQSFEKNSYTYIRMNNSIRVQFNAEALYTYDYVMYQNANYGTKWFYAFIIGFNYINENTTELVLELDVMQTWYFDYTLVQGFVEREHVNDDTVGLHLNAEPSMDLQYQRVGFTKNISAPKWGVLLLNAYMHYPDAVGAEPTSADACTGVWAQNQYSACRYAIYDLLDSESREALSFDVQSLNKIGAAETIADAYTLPAHAFSSSDLEKFPIKVGDTWTTTGRKVWTLKNETTMKAVTQSIPRPTTMGTYTPRNKKLLCYPYTYLEIGDFTGRAEDWRYEYFTLTNQYLKLKESISGSSDCQGYVTPINYQGISNGETDTQLSVSAKPFTFDVGNKISWVYSAYQTWAAQNALNNQLATIGGIASIAFSIIPGISAASSSLGAGMSLVGGLSAIRGGASLASREAIHQAGKAAGKLVDESSQAGVAGGIAMLAGLSGKISQMRKVPNTVQGNTSGNARQQNGYNGWYSCTMTLLPEYAQIVDGFFDMYGYQVDRVKVPNRTGRTYWNYVKMQNSCHRGNVPSDQMDKINRIYDAGITFWHTSDVGNYSLNNTIV